jgi:hypothetical protein
MWKTILYFLIVNLVFLTLVVGIYAIGYEYDRANKLYPESVRVSYDVSLGGIHGQRWVRFLDAMLILGLTADIVIIFIWYIRYRMNHSQKQSLNSIIK